VIDSFSDRLLKNPKIVDAHPVLHEWHTVTFDEVSKELANTHDEFKVPEREKAEVLAAFGAEKSEVAAGSQPGAVNWRRGVEPGIAPGTCLS
jgi:hypothetical protein